MSETTWSGIARVLQLHAALRPSRTVQELFARASEVALETLPFDRIVVLSVGATTLHADDSGSLAHEPSDALRRRVQARPVALAPRTLEAVALNRGADVRHAGPRHSTLAVALELREFAIAPVAPVGTALALVVCDRESSPVEDSEQEAVDAFASILAMALEQTVLRMRNQEISVELRHLTASAQALLAELNDAPMELPSSRGQGPRFAWDALAAPAGVAAPGLLSNREVEIVERLAAGRSNREIAEDLVLSPETVKGHVARILRKLGATNRVEAVTRYLAMARGGTSP